MESRGGRLNLRYYFRICLQELMKIMEYLSHYNRPPDRDLYKYLPNTKK